MQIIDDSRIPDFPPPDEVNYSRQYQGLNQIPTCSMFRREDALRVGGYRDWGKLAGEDADFFLRLILHTGKRAYRVSSSPLFMHRQHDSHYWNKPDQYRQRGIAPLVERQLLAMPNAVRDKDISHIQYTNPVRHYHEPIITIYIRGDEGLLNTLDSLEVLPFYRWVAVNDKIGAMPYAPYLRKMTLKQAKQLAPLMMIVESNTILSHDLIDKIRTGCEPFNDKKRGIVMCCGNNKQLIPDASWINEQLASGDYVEAVYTGIQQSGGKPLQGAITVISLHAKITKKMLINGKNNYGRRSPGDVFLVHRRDIELDPHKFIPVPPSEGDNIPYAVQTIYEELS
jgi:hypothetical protein